MEKLLDEGAAASIRMILETVCLHHRLPISLTWIIDPDSNDLLLKDYWVNDLGMLEYVTACIGKPLKKGQDVAGKAVNLRKHYSVPNVSLLDLADYPFVNAARNFGLRAAMAIRLKRKSGGKIEYVSEIFLPTNLQDKVEQDNLIVEILSSLHKICEFLGTVELQIDSLLYQEGFSDTGAGSYNCIDDFNWEDFEDLMPTEDVEAAVSESSLDLSNVGLNLKETIQNNTVETDGQQATARECELSEPEKRSDQTPEVLALLRAVSRFSSNGGLNSNEKITGEADEPNELEVRKQNAEVEHGVDGNNQEVEMHDSQQGNSINRQKKTKCTLKPRKNTSVVWEFFGKVQENGFGRAKCPACGRLLGGTSKNGTSSLHKHGCFKDWKKDVTQQPVSNVEFNTKVNPKIRASPTNGADAPPHAKRSKLVAKVGEREADKEREEETSTDSIFNDMSEVQDPTVPDIGQAAVPGLVHDHVQELTVQDDNTTKETPRKGLMDQESRSVIELLPTETQSSGQQASNMAIDGTRGLPQVRCTQIELTAEGGHIAASTTSSIPTTTPVSGVSVAYELKSFLSQSPQVLLSSAEIDTLCPLLNAAINAARNEWEKLPMRELLAEAHRLKEAIATRPSSSPSKTLPLQGYENFASAISQSAISRSSLEAEITLLNHQAAQLEGQLKAINEQRSQKRQSLSILEEEAAAMQTRALQNSQAITTRVKIDSIVSGMFNLFELVKSVLS